jgi:ribosomal-protein-alanine N-acetyltransferase
MDPPKAASDGVVRLRELRPDDVAAYLGAFADDPDLARSRGLERVPDEEKFHAWLAPSEDVAEMAICETGDDTLLGSVIVHSIDRRHRRAELGYWLVPSARGRGLATRALALTLEWMFEQLGLERAELATTPDNRASRAVARRLGFAEEGLARGRDIEDERRVDVVLYGLLRSDWRRSRSSSMPSSTF